MQFLLQISSDYEIKQIVVRTTRWQLFSFRELRYEVKYRWRMNGELLVLA